MRLKYLYIAAISALLAPSCHTLEKASRHGFYSGYYKLKYDRYDIQQVYVDVSEERIDVHQMIQKQPDKQVLFSVPLTPTDSFNSRPIIFIKKSLDVDLTAMLLKFRPAIYTLPGQMITDFNAAVYAGWRRDHFIVKERKDPLGKQYQSMRNWGYDVGLFAGLGSASISPFSTRNLREDEYSGMIFQTGVAGFWESSLASFGLAVGFDYLPNEDRAVWVYHNKPWIGFMVGIALN